MSAIHECVHIKMYLFQKTLSEIADMGTDKQWPGEHFLYRQKGNTQHDPFWKKTNTASAEITDYFPYSLPSSLTAITFLSSVTDLDTDDYLN